MVVEPNEVGTDRPEPQQRQRIATAGQDPAQLVEPVEQPAGHVDVAYGIASISGPRQGSPAIAASRTGSRPAKKSLELRAIGMSGATSDRASPLWLIVVGTVTIMPECPSSMS